MKPHPLDRYSARDRAIGKRITLSFGAWLEKCERSDAWHDGDYEPTLENVKAFLDDYADWQAESDPISKAAAALGKRGGKAGTGKAKARSAEHYRLAGIKSGEARRKKRDKQQA